MTLTSVWNQVKVYAKAIAAFIAGIAGNVVVNLLNGSTPWPQTTAQWGQLALTSFGPAIAVWFTTGKITQKQLDKDPNVIGGVVVPDRPLGIPGSTGTVLGGNITAIPGEYQPPWPKP